MLFYMMFRTEKEALSWCFHAENSNKNGFKTTN